MLSSSSSQFALSVSEEMEWKQAFAALRPKTKMTSEAKKTRHFLKHASLFFVFQLCKRSGH